MFRYLSNFNINYKAETDMGNNDEKFADDLDQQDHSQHKEGSGDHHHNDLADKWNEIQDEYMESHSDLDIDDLYFEGGGFSGMIQKISEITGKSVEAVRKEIEDW